jgi:large repetitive protein
VLLNNAGASPTATTMVSNANPAVLRQIVTYTATVAAQSGGLPTGKVKFQDGSRTIATVTLTGNQAAYSTKYTAPDAHLISATYTGDLNEAGSTSDTLTEYIQDHSKTTLTTSGSPSYVGQPVTFTAMVTSYFGSVPDGELVTFYDGTTTLGTVTLAGGMANYTTSSLAAKSHHINATYSGDSMFLTSTGHLLQVMNKYPTTTTLDSSPNPAPHGQPVTITATVSSSGSGMPAGKVTFKDGAIGIGTAVLSGGVAKLTKSKLVVGTHPITAQYLGDSVSDKSTSTVLNQVVQ